MSRIPRSRKISHRRLGHAADDARRAAQPKRVVVRFKDEFDVPAGGVLDGWLTKYEPAQWARFKQAFPAAVLQPAYGRDGAARLAVLVEKARRRDPSYRPPRFAGHFLIAVPPGQDGEAMAKLLSTWGVVARVYLQPPPARPPDVDRSDDDYSDDQGYLVGAPEALGVESAWIVKGGDGAGQSLVDVEQGWNLDHEDLDSRRVSMLWGKSETAHYHGTSVLGIIGAVDNDLGIVGIAPAVASMRCSSQWDPEGEWDTYAAILNALEAMKFGDVLLLEVQSTLTGYYEMPAECDDDVFDLVRLASALGIVVVEAAGNGKEDLDAVEVADAGFIFRRSVRDSGAIIVGAAHAAEPHTRHWTTSYGSRIDCYAWGEKVVTLSTDPAGTAKTLYDEEFGETSAAAAIIAGAALVLQGMAEASLGHRLSPGQVRMLLSDPETGTALDGGIVDEIGVMPDLARIIDGEVLKLLPDVYARDFVGDTGDVHEGAIAESPDVILITTEVADPQAAFGEGSGTEEDATLGLEATAGVDNFVHVRVRNRGGRDAADVEVRVYWAHPSTLLTPADWNLLGSTTIAAVPSGDVLTVSDAIVWPAADVPASGHYCFVALVGCTEDPVPEPADFLSDWEKFKHYVRNNNNVTWRNFSVIDYDATADSSGEVAFAFLIAGAPDEARPMDIEVVGRLPAGSRVSLELPRELAALMPGAVAEEERDDLFRVPVPATGILRFADVPIPARSHHPARLRVRLPDSPRRGAFSLHARQVHGGVEVGRVTWRIVRRG